MTGSIKSALAGKRSSPVWCGRQVKRRRALRARNPPRDSLADGAPMASVLPGSQAEPGSLVGHRTPELCLPKRTGIRSLTSPAVIRQAAVLLLHRRELPPRLHPAMAPGGFFRCWDRPQQPSIRVSLWSGQSLFTAYAWRRSWEARAGAHPSVTRFPLREPGPMAAAPTRYPPPN